MKPQSIDEAVTEIINTVCPSTTGAGVKYDQGKPRTDLLPWDALLSAAEVLAYGAGKYGDRNWEKGLDEGRLVGAMLRHLAADQMGEKVDPESGLPHFGHMLCSCLMLVATRMRKDASRVR